MQARAALKTLPGVATAQRLASLRSCVPAAKKLRASGLPVAAAYADALRDLHVKLDGDDRTAVDLIEALRARLRTSDAAVAMTDFGAGSNFAPGEGPAKRDASTTVGEITRTTSKPPRWARFLFHVVRNAKPAHAVELGTSMGISGAYQGSALRLNGQDGKLVTIEGSPSSANLAEGHLRGLGLVPDVVSIRTGTFGDVLPGVLEELATVDYVFVDGHHDEDATKEYFAAVKPFLTPGATVVFDDIRWSAGMQRAWRAVQDDPDVSVVLDCRTVGIVAVDPSAKARVAVKVRIG